jgi:sec-independent protein translocase protein TatA
VFRQFGAQELLIILLIVVLLFGAKKLPETARGLGRSLRIFKAETKGLSDDEQGESSSPQQITASADDAPHVPAADPARQADERS